MPNLDAIVNTTAKSMQQIFNIDKLEFPNVSNSDDIRKALINLPLHATIRAYSNNNEV
jgi:hypothetical protein